MKLSRHFRNKKKEGLKAKIDKLETNNRIEKMPDTCTGASMALRWVNSLRTNIVKNKKGDSVTDFHSVLLGGGTISFSY